MISPLSRARRERILLTALQAVIGLPLDIGLMKAVDVVRDSGRVSIRRWNNGWVVQIDKSTWWYNPLIPSPLVVPSYSETGLRRWFGPLDEGWKYQGLTRRDLALLKTGEENFLVPKFLLKELSLPSGFKADSLDDEILQLKVAEGFQRLDTYCVHLTTGKRKELAKAVMAKWEEMKQRSGDILAPPYNAVYVNEAGDAFNVFIVPRVAVDENHAKDAQTFFEHTWKRAIDTGNTFPPWYDYPEDTGDSEGPENNAELNRLRMRRYGESVLNSAIGSQITHGLTAGVPDTIITEFARYKYAASIEWSVKIAFDALSSPEARTLIPPYQPHGFLSLPLGYVDTPYTGNKLNLTAQAIKHIFELVDREPLSFGIGLARNVHYSYDPKEGRYQVTLFYRDTRDLTENWVVLPELREAARRGTRAQIECEMFIGVHVV